MPRYDSYGSLDSPISQDGDTSFRTVNARLRPDQLSPGTVVESLNGRMGLDGSWQTRKGVEAFGGALLNAELGLTLPFYLYANVTITAAARVDDLVTVTTSGAHSFNDQTVVSIDDVTGIVDPTGNRLITVTDTNEFTFLIAGATGNETYTLGGSPTAGAPILVTPAAAYGHCKFSDPVAASAEYIIIARKDDAIAISVPDGAGTVIAYPTGLTLSAECDMMQVFDKVYLFRDGLTSWEWDGDLTGSPAFVKVANGNYAASVYLNAATNTVIADGIATVSETAHGLAVGARIFVVDNGTTELVEGGTVGYVVATVPNANSFTFYAQVPDHAAHAVVYTTRISSGRGFTHMPAPPWAAYHQRRLWMPYYYTTTGTSGSEVVASRNVRDEIIASDILDADTYDQLQHQFRVTAGTADYLVAIHPFTDDNMLAMNRNSLHLVSGVSGELTDITIKQITNETGVVARKSVVQIANSIYFLSDNGIYAAEFGDLYNLRGAGLPLSDPIQPTIDRINRDYTKNAVAVYHDNRYWIAVPLDGSMVNNAILVYNLLNQGWESVDTVDASSWNITGFIAAGSGAINRLYAINKEGGIHILDAREDESDLIQTQAGEAPENLMVQSSVTTRAYTHNSIGRKAFNEFELHIESSSANASDGVLAGIAENLDSEFQINTLQILNGNAPIGVAEDASLRGRIGRKRAYALSIKLTPTQGRPKLRAVATTANRTFETLTKAD